MKALAFYFIMLFTLLVAIAGCGKEIQQTSDAAEDTHLEEHQHHNGDIREETADTTILPEFLKDKPEDMKLIYAAAANHEDLLTYIPCYCGCGESVGHKSSYNCFVAERNDDRILWDDHGTKCGVCLQIAAESIAKFQKGDDLKSIRDDIDTRYKEGYAVPTPTPMPS